MKIKILPFKKPDAEKFWKNLSPIAKAIFVSASGFTVAAIYLLLEALRSKQYPMSIALVMTTWGTLLLMFTVFFIWKKPRMVVILLVSNIILYTAGTKLIFLIPYTPITPEMMTDKRKILTLLGLIFVYLGFILFVTLIKKEGLAKVRLQTEMDLAKKIHDILVPPVSVKTNTIEIHGRSVPVGEMGGDLIDTMINGDTATCIIADVSGHGISAGVVMSTFKSIIHTLDSEDISLAAMFTRTNAILYELKQKSMFVTAAAVRVLSPTEAEFSVAGHLPILHFSPKKQNISRLNLKQIALGIRPDTHFVSQTITIEPGDLFALVTDGLTEIVDKKEQLLGLNPLEKCIQDDLDQSLPGIDDAVFNRARSHGIPHDDQTILLVRCL